MKTHLNETYSRRDILTVLASLGIGTAAFQRALAAEAEVDAKLTAEMIADSEWVAGIELSDVQRTMAADALQQARKSMQAMRDEALDNALSPALIFKPLEDASEDSAEPHVATEVRFRDASVVAKPDSNADLAFLPVSELSALMRRREISSVQLTKLYLQRLQHFDPLLKCVVNLTEDLALRQAALADREIAAGQYRGPLHGIPWGAKDLIAHPQYPTTWGAPQYRDQVIDTTAAVAAKLEAAGAVLVAKLSLGSYALGDQWFAGKTRNPWNPNQGSSGSSAGSAAAVSAGLVGFAIGTETMGSITSPSKRCGVTGLRPTFGRVSRFGCMTLCWSLDKLGPICRTVEDCGVVLGAIHGRDHRDHSSVTRNFDWPSQRQLSTIRVGYVKDESKQAKRNRPELDILRQLNVQLVPIEIPKHPHRDMLSLILTAEAASVFDALTRKQEPKGVRYWPKTFVMGQFISANDYLKANRIRMQVMESMRSLMRDVDVIVGASILRETNMSGHPQIVVPNGFRDQDGFQVPNSLSFTGRLFDETTLLLVADAYQKATGHHLQRPNVDEFLKDKDSFNEQSDLLDDDKLYGE